MVGFSVLVFMYLSLQCMVYKRPSGLLKESLRIYLATLKMEFDADAAANGFLIEY